jgi:outer membrane protein
MNQFSKYLNFLLLAAVLILFVLHFTSRVPDTGTTAGKETSNNDTSTVQSGIVYVDLERLLLEYQYSIDLNQQSVRQKSSLEGRMQKELSAFEAEMESYQNKLARGGFISTQSAENKKEELIQKQQELQELKMNLENEWYAHEQELERKLYESIVNYLKELSSREGYHYVLSQVAGSDVLVANPKLDITDTVLFELNARYTAQKADQ